MATEAAEYQVAVDLFLMSTAWTTTRALLSSPKLFLLL